MGRYVAGDSPEMDRKVREAIKGIGGDIEALRQPKLLGVVLCGGYGRGEGGVAELARGKRRLSDSFEFCAVARDGAGRRDLAAIQAALVPVSVRWRDVLGVSMDFGRVRTLRSIRRRQDSVTVQNLLHGYCDVAGMKGAEMFRDIAVRQPSELQWIEAVRTLVNCGVGLVFTVESDAKGFVLRNVNRCVLGAGDALLIARGQYAWKVTDRAAALCDPRYTAAMECNFRPVGKTVCGRDEARKMWFAAVDEVLEAGRKGGAMKRSFGQAVRWLLRRRTVGDRKTLGYDPVLRMLLELVGVVRAERTMPPSLRRDWEIFG